jgi:hypothetical protein
MTTVSASYDMSGGSYPTGMDVDGPQQQSRLSVFLRIIFAIPILLFAGIVGIGMAVVALIAWFVILFTGKYPAGMANFSAGGVRLSARALGYCYMLTDKYPPFSLDEDSSYPIRAFATVQLEGRNRLTTFFRIIMAIPHLIVISILNYVMEIVGFIAWLIVLITGSMPGGLHNFIAGYVRWNIRNSAYVMLLTDEYPPFSLS